MATYVHRFQLKSAAWEEMPAKAAVRIIASATIRCIASDDAPEKYILNGNPVGYVKMHAPLLKNLKREEYALNLKDLKFPHLEECRDKSHEFKVQFSQIHFISLEVDNLPRPESQKWQQETILIIEDILKECFGSPPHGYVFYTKGSKPRVDRPVFIRAGKVTEESELHRLSKRRKAVEAREDEEERDEEDQQSGSSEEERENEEERVEAPQGDGIRIRRKHGGSITIISDSEEENEEGQEEQNLIGSSSHYSLPSPEYPDTPDSPTASTSHFYSSRSPRS